MKQVDAFALCFLCIIGCAKSITPGPDSETNWLRCSTVDDCQSDKAIECLDRYCVDAEGERISATDASALDATNDASGDESVAALQIEGVWIFEHDSDDHGDALHSGLANIANGCLVVDDAVIVWHVSQRVQAENLVSEVLSGKHPQIRLGGGGLSLNEGSTLDDFPAAVTEHCAISEVWFAVPTTAEILPDVSEDAQIELPSCTWPAELVEQGDSTREFCSGGRFLVDCEVPLVAHQICVSDNPESCPDSSSVSGSWPCTSLCEPEEYGSICGGVGGGVADPPEGCRMMFANPGGIAQYCCPCL